MEKRQDDATLLVDAVRNAVLGFLVNNKVTHSEVVETEMKMQLEGKPVVRVEDGGEMVYFNGWQLNKKTRELTKVIDRGRELYDIKVVFVALTPQPSVANVAVIRDLKKP